MDRLESMSILVAAVEAGSLSAAARRLGMPLATVSRKVSELEAHLKTRLLNRSSRRLTLTDAGRSYVAACRRILEDVGEAERAAAGEYSAPKGELIVTAPIVFGRLHVLPVAMEFLEAFPEIDLRLVLADRLLNLQEDHVDLAVRIGELPDSSLVATRVGPIRRVVCASPAYFAARGTPRDPGDLSDHDCITFEGLMSPRAWTFASGQVRHVGRGPLAADRQHRRGRHRRGHRGDRHHARALVPDRRCGAGGHARHGTRGIRAGALAGQPGPCGTAAVAAEAAGLPGFRGDAAEGAAFAGWTVGPAGRSTLVLISDLCPRIVTRSTGPTILLP